MKNLFRTIGIIAMIAVIGFSMVSCSDGGGGGGDNPPGGKATGGTVNAPTLASKTSNSITITAPSAPSTGQAIEYSTNTSNTPSATWQDGLAFSGLTPSTTYYIFARVKENTTHNAGTPSSPLQETTNSTPSYSILSFSFFIENNTYHGVINEDERRISVTVPFGTNLTSLIPIVTVSDNADYSPKTAQNFTNPVNYYVGYSISPTGLGVMETYIVEVEVEDCEHNYTWIIETYPTDSIDGNELNICFICNDVKEEKTLTFADYKAYWHGTWKQRTTSFDRFITIDDAWLNNPNTHPEGGSWGYSYQGHSWNNGTLRINFPSPIYFEYVLMEDKTSIRFLGSNSIYTFFDKVEE